MKTRLQAMLFAAALVALPGLLPAQSPPPSFRTPYVPGVEGIKGASLPPPGMYVRDYIVFYAADQLNGANGDKLPMDFDAKVYANLLRCLWITDWKVLGGSVGMDAIVPFVYTDLSIVAGGATLYDKSESGIGDLFVEPLTISWHAPRYDAAVAYGVFAPTADSEPGTAKPGKGFWTHMFTAGATLYFDQGKTWSFSALNRYEINTEEDDTNIKPGQAWTVECGLGKSLRPTIDVGVVGYYQLQTTDDSGAGASTDRDQVTGLGAELVVFCPKTGLFVSLRDVQEFDAEDRPEGNTATMTLTKRF